MRARPAARRAKSPIRDLIADEKTKKRGAVIRIIYTRRAEEELRAIWRYIAEDNDNEPAADR